VAVNRRALLQFGLGMVAGAAISWPAAAARFVNRTGLAAGQFIWEPSQPAAGPVLVVVSLHDRLVHVFKDGRVVGISTCRVNGGHKPAGIFVLIGDAFQAEGASGASGIFTAAPLDAHNGLIDARSMGSVRVPDKFAALLAGIAERGTVVVVAPRRSRAEELVSPAFLDVQDATSAPHPSRTAVTTGGSAPGAREPSLSILVSVSDAHAMVLREGIPAQSVPVEVREPRERVGTHVYSLLGEASGSAGLRWLALGLAGSSNDPALIHWKPETALSRVTFPHSAESEAILGSLRPGATLIVTDKPMPASRRRSLRGAAILAGEGASVRPAPPTSRTPPGSRYAESP
jgi:hypothetical protein